MLIKPFMTAVNSNGQAIITVEQNIHGLQWKVFQVGFALGKVSQTAQVAAHVNGIPLAPSILMQPSVFGPLSGSGSPPYAMEAFMVGPPYIILQPGDQMVCGVINAVAGDIFTIGAYVEEHQASANLTMGS